MITSEAGKGLIQTCLNSPDEPDWEGEEGFCYTKKMKCSATQIRVLLFFLPIGVLKIKIGTSKLYIYGVSGIF